MAARKFFEAHNFSGVTHNDFWVIKALALVAVLAAKLRSFYPVVLFVFFEVGGKQAHLCFPVEEG